VVPVPEEQLPVLLPEDVEFLGAKGNPLETSKSFLHTSCPTCGGSARRETDTMDTFMDSSWYVFRYLDPHNNQAPFAFDPAKYWLPLDYYVGLVEHAGCHMIYFRFFVKMLQRYGMLPVDEPVYNFFNNGIVKMDGHKMSKSRGNVVSPDEVMQLYGADALRFYILSDSPPDQDVDWNTRTLQGIWRYMHAVWSTFERVMPFIRPVALDELRAQPWSTREQTLRRLLHTTIQKVEGDILGDRHNTAIAALRTLTNAWQDYVNGLSLESLTERDQALLSELTTDVVLLLAPLMPFLAEEMWSQLKHSTSVHVEPWPTVDEQALQTREAEIVVQINGRKRKVLAVPLDAPQDEVDALVRNQVDLVQMLEQHDGWRVVYVPNRLINYVGR
jgi:leucyl-tRNA synthetase